MAVNQKLVNNLKVILGGDVEHNIVEYISTMKHEEDFEEFMENIVNKNNIAHVNAYNAIKFAIFGDKLKKKHIQKPVVNQQKQIKPEQIPQDNQNSNKKGKKKFKDINTFQEKKKQKEGRQLCDCMGQEHDFMNNCLECGRIHCDEEGPGPCLYCGTPISVRGYNQNASNTKAMKQKKNVVFDDDNDYFKINSKSSEASKKKIVVALDFASRKVIESTDEDVRLRRMLLEDSIEHLKRVETLYSNIKKNQAGPVSKKNNTVNDELVDLLIQMRHKKPKEKEDLDQVSHIDQGLCLSMHQPYASLLVAGVKRHEGRTWPTTHRGRLWIAAAARQPEEEEIVALEDFYKQFYNDQTLKFPREYPTSSLLGCVTVEDCLNQEDYKKRFGDNDESTSPYVMICSNPIILPIFYPISGKHKIYPVDKDLHKCARMALQHAKYV
ncbi:hypothetical protein GWI33_022817 [Rhynchophorus ferrugineus]|uniref:Activating signal cointegrator 1 n=1 Tax=Rhynchophorus ferrugineus TaxID=354439 RepID=A0A834IPC7_RHYFE|nr:hypothetical protein GWI33_022817 [Rhynchophorus ferrugineus]